VRAPPIDTLADRLVHDTVQQLAPDRGAKAAAWAVLRASVRQQIALCPPLDVANALSEWSDEIARAALELWL
jgi:hypothetical protein